MAVSECVESLNTDEVGTPEIDLAHGSVAEFDEDVLEGFSKIGCRFGAQPESAKGKAVGRALRAGDDFPNELRRPIVLDDRHEGP